MHPGYTLLACLKEFGLTDLPEFIEVQYLDDIDFFNLSKEGIPEDLLELPVLTISKKDKEIMYINFNKYTENEYYVSELIVSQLIKIMMQKDPLIHEFKQKCKNSFLQKNIEYGASLFLEYKELSLLMTVMHNLYNTKEYTIQKRNPYTFKQSRKIALKMLRRTLEEKQNSEKISSILYCMARLQNNNTYNYSNIVKDQKLANNLFEFNNLLKDYNFENISKQILNKIGILGKILSQPTPIELLKEKEDAQN